MYLQNIYCIAKILTDIIFTGMLKKQGELNLVDVKLGVSGRNNH